MDGLPALLDTDQRQHGLLHLHSAPHGFFVDRGRGQLPHDHHLHEGSGRDLGQDEHVYLVHPCRLHHPDNLRPGARGGCDHAVVRQVPGHELFQPGSGRQPPDLREPFLVLFAPGRVCDIPAGHRAHLRDNGHLRQEQDIQLQEDSLLRRTGRRGPRRSSLGPSPVRRRHTELDDTHPCLHDAHNKRPGRASHDRPSGHALQGLDPLRHAHALRGRVRVPLPHRRAHRHT